MVKNAILPQNALFYKRSNITHFRYFPTYQFLPPNAIFHVNFAIFSVNFMKFCADFGIFVRDIFRDDILHYFSDGSWRTFMSFDNKTLLIAGLVIGGIACLYVRNTELASAIFGGLIGYLSKDSITIKHEEVESEDGSDSEIA